MNQSIPLSEYPRPLLVRSSYLCLNGTWEFSESAPTYGETILVPYPPQSKASGIGRDLARDAVIYYRRRFTLPEGFLSDRVILHFGAVDRFATVTLNGHTLGTHDGGYHHFSFDITDFLTDGENTLELSVTDTQDDVNALYGKQKIKRGGMWYTPVSGIWQTVWLESVPTDYIRSLKTSTHGASVRVEAEGVDSGELLLHLPNGDEAYPISDGVCEFSLPDPQFWSPDSPYLYRFTARTESDSADSYFALRDVEIKTVDGLPRICLNGSPLFFKGLLDQGYFPDGIYTPLSYADYERDILAAKKLGYNTLRKHIKIEPDAFYEACDRLGMVVFQDMVSGGSYSFLRDTLLPTFGMQKKDDRRMNRSEIYRSAFLRDMERTVSQLFSFPSICYWTIFNEGWGQFESEKCYQKLVSLDSSRVIDTASGWFRGATSDVESLHIYFRKPKIKPSPRPIVLSEFGGYVYRVKGHLFSESKTYGYGSYKTRADFNAAYNDLWKNGVEPLIAKGLCAAIYTQLSDVEEEANGLLTYDREVCKID